MLVGLFYFADLQGKLAVDREIAINNGKPIEDHLRILLYALGFSIPILAKLSDTFFNKLIFSINILSNSKIKL